MGGGGQIKIKINLRGKQKSKSIVEGFAKQTNTKYFMHEGCFCIELGALRAFNVAATAGKVCKQNSDKSKSDLNIVHNRARIKIVSH